MTGARGGGGYSIGFCSNEGAFDGGRPGGAKNRAGIYHVVNACTISIHGEACFNGVASLWAQVNIWRGLCRGHVMSRSVLSSLLSKKGKGGKNIKLRGVVKKKDEGPFSSHQQLLFPHILAHHINGKDFTKTIAAYALT